MIKDGEYIVLSEENVEQVVELTGKTENDIQKMWADSVKFGNVQVFWREFNQWFTFAVDCHYVTFGILDSVIKEVIGSHAKELRNGPQVVQHFDGDAGS